MNVVSEGHTNPMNDSNKKIPMQSIVFFISQPLRIFQRQKTICKTRLSGLQLSKGLQGRPQCTQSAPRANRDWTGTATTNLHGTAAALHNRNWHQMYAGYAGFLSNGIRSRLELKDVAQCSWVSSLSSGALADGILAGGILAENFLSTLFMPWLRSCQHHER